MRTGRALQLEIESRKKTGTDFRNKAADGPYLKIGGALWQLSSRATAARPKFIDGKPVLEEVTDQFPAAEAMLEAQPDGGGVDVMTCPTCGHQRIEFDILDQTDWLQAALLCAAEALAGPGGKYALNDEQLGDLLAVTAESAEWLVQLTQWAKGEDTAPDTIIPAERTFSEEEMAVIASMINSQDQKPKRSFRQRLGGLVAGKHGN